MPMFVVIPGIADKTTWGIHFKALMKEKFLGPTTKSITKQMMRRGHWFENQQRACVK
jgi:hypothetical protein